MLYIKLEVGSTIIFWETYKSLKDISITFYIHTIRYEP